MTLKRVRFRVLGVVAALTLLPAGEQAARAQGMLVDRRPHIAIARSYEIREVSVDVHLRDQVAEVQVSQTFHNPGSVQLEAEYDFPLPEDGTIQSFVLMVDGREWPGRILTRDEARRIYEEIVRTKPRPARLLEYMGRGLLPHERLPDFPPGGRTQGDDAVHPGLVKPRPRCRRVQLPVQHSEVHHQADRAAGAAPRHPQPGPDQVDLQPGRRSRDRAPGRARSRGLGGWCGTTSCPGPTSGLSTRSPREAARGDRPLQPPDSSNT